MRKRNSKLPRFPTWVFGQLILPEDKKALLGDLEEDFKEIAKGKGILAAYVWYLMHLAKALPVFTFYSLYRGSIMLKNYFKLTARFIRRNKGHSFLNLASLAIGMTGCLLILLFVNDELSYDTYYDDTDQLYRISSDVVLSGIVRHFASAPGALAKALVEEVPGIMGTTRLFREYDLFVRKDNKVIEKTDVLLSETNFFDFFTYEFLKGDSKSALSEPHTMVITKRVAEKIFNDQNPINEVLTIDGAGNFTITGVIQDIPRNSHFAFDYIASYTSMPQNERDIIDNEWTSLHPYTYIKIEKTADPKQLKTLTNELYEKNVEAEDKDLLHFKLQKVSDIYLHSRHEFDIGTDSDIAYVYLFSVIAFFILFIACINFMNLATAKSMLRSKEVGLRKVFGAYKNQLINQFLSESFFMALLGMVISIASVYFLLPYFNNLTGKELHYTQLMDTKIILMVTATIVFTGLFAGSYPAFFLSAFRPINALKGKIPGQSSRHNFRKILVVTQFSISIILITSTFLILDQLSFMKNKDMGFTKEQIIVVKIQDHNNTYRKYKTIKHELEKHPNVVSATFTQTVPGNPSSARVFLPGGRAETDTEFMNLIQTDLDFVETYGIEIVEGRNFSEEITSDSSEGFLINEAAARKLGWFNDAVGREFKHAGHANRPGRIVGVMKDFNIISPKQNIGPLVVYVNVPETRNVSVKINSDNISETVKYIEEKWQEFEPGSAFDYFFLDENFGKLFRSETKLSEVFTNFAVLAIVIACLGLFGLASHTAEQRTKEIGIRKVLGASTDSLVVKLSGEFVKWILLANLIAFPISYFLLNKWLQTFAYHTEISMYLFFATALLSVVIGLATVGYKSIRASVANPIQSLRSD